MRATPSTRLSLLARVQSLDEEAWREFEGAYNGLIIRYCRRRGLQLADAEDVCQIVMAKLSRSLGSFQYDPRRGRFRDYLGRCAQNAVNSFLASHKRLDKAVSACGAAGPEPAADDTPATLWHDEWVHHHYRRAMRALEGIVDQRSLDIFDALVRGRSAEEIEARFSISRAALRKTKQRLKDRLREIIERQIADESPHPATTRAATR